MCHCSGKAAGDKQVWLCDSGALCTNTGSVRPTGHSLLVADAEWKIDGGLGPWLHAVNTVLCKTESYWGGERLALCYFTIRVHTGVTIYLRVHLNRVC